MSTVPRRTVLTQLRAQLIPPARACLRDERRGRADHAIRATFELRVEYGEIVELSLEGELPDPLRACLLQAADALVLPRVETVLDVRYPIYTEAAAAEDADPLVELDAQTRAIIDAVGTSFDPDALRRTSAPRD